uniref:Uncharacterized protein n=1 Tax=Callithrix jacchus TaxID=9483 RepID=A0A5F4WEB6_CALJA
MPSQSAIFKNFFLEMSSRYVTQAGSEFLDAIDPPTLAFQVLGFLWEYSMVQQEII